MSVVATNSIIEKDVTVGSYCRVKQHRKTYTGQIAAHGKRQKLRIVYNNNHVYIWPLQLAF